VTESPGPGGGAAPIRRLAAEPWSRESLQRFVAGQTIFVRDEFARTVPVPTWLAACAAACDERSSDELVASVHPDERVRATEAFVACLSQPGEPVRLSVRAYRGGSWQHHHLCWLNLLDAPGMGFVILTSEIVAGSPIEPPAPDDDDDEHFAVTDWMYFRHAPSGKILVAEGKVVEILGYETHEMVGHLAMEFIPPAAMASAVAAHMHINASPGATGTRRHQWRRKDGTDVWTESTLINVGRPGGPVEIMEMCWDITEKLASEKAVSQSREQLRLLAEQVPAGVFLCDGDGRITFHSGRWERMSLDAGTGDPIQLIVHPDARAAVVAAVRRLIDEDGTDEMSLTASSPDGERALLLSLRSDGEPDRARRMVIGSVEDVTATERLRRQARVDPLTGLLNRLALEEHLADALTRDPSTTTVTFVDLDGFKDVNDTHGHDAGDTVLRVVAERLGKAVRPADAVSRYGGDEFVIVCQRLSAESAVLLPHRIEAALADTIAFAGGTWQPAASIGSVSPAPGDDPAAVLRRADHAMYETKRTRRSRG
jgi:diguanylate cyclase (GGDEF)-like protein/PAS domain S-box-containing protein